MSGALLESVDLLTALRDEPPDPASLERIRLALRQRRDETRDPAALDAAIKRAKAGIADGLAALPWLEIWSEGFDSLVGGLKKTHGIASPSAGTGRMTRWPILGGSGSNTIGTTSASWKALGRKA